MDIGKLKAFSKEEIPRLTQNLDANDVDFLVKCLVEKDNNVRYNAFLLLQAVSRQFPSVYQYWDVLEGKLQSDNSFQRSLGLMLLAENVRWDKGAKFTKTVDEYLSHCADEKFITARQTIQGLANIIDATDAYSDKIKQYLASFPIGKYPKSQQNLLNKDISNVLGAIELKKEKRESG